MGNIKETPEERVQARFLKYAKRQYRKKKHKKKRKKHSGGGSIWTVRR